MKASVIAFLFLALQVPAPGRLSLQGRVVKAGTNEPVVRASIVVAKVEGRLEDYRTILTDGAGRFAFTDLTAGTYRVFATRTGYLRAEYGRRAAATSTRIALTAGQAQSDILLSMTPAGVIAGRVRDDDGLPVRNAWVRALRATYRDGERQLETVEFGQTNDLGDYRIFDLPSGHYFINATLDRPRIEGERYVAPANPIQISDSDRGYRFVTIMPGATALADGLVAPSAFDRSVFFPVYYPSTRNDSEATSIELHAGAILSGIDLTMASIPTVHVRGLVVNGVTGQPVPNTLVTIPPLESVRSSATGTFDIPGVPAGRYELWTSAWPVDLQGVTRVDVADRDVEGVALVMQPTITLIGRVTIDGRLPNASDPMISVRLSTSPGRAGINGANIRDGMFTLVNVSPGDYRLRISGPNVFVKAARFGAADVLNTPMHVEQDLRGQQLEISVSLKTGVLEVRVLNDRQQPAPSVPVVMVPDAALRNRSDLYKVAATDAAGRVRIEGVAPGDYRVFASEEIDPQTWQDPAVIRTYESRGELVRIEENGRREVNLRLISVPQ